MWDFFFTPETLSYAVLICREARSKSISRKCILKLIFKGCGYLTESGLQEKKPIPAVEC